MSNVNQNSNLIAMGAIKSASGLKGHFNIFLFDQDTNLLNKSIPLYAKTKEGNFIKLIIESINSLNTKIKFKGINDRSEAENFGKLELYMDKNDMPPLEEDEVYLDDLIGVNVYETSKEFLGKITNIYSNSVQDILVIDDGKIEIPFISNFIIDVDLDNNQIIINNPSYI